MAYGSFLEYQREVEISQEISNVVQHRVAFLKVAKSTILAVVKLNCRENVELQRWPPREGTLVKIGFRLPNMLKLKDLNCMAVAISDVFNLLYHGSSLFYIPGANYKLYSKFSVTVGQRLSFYAATLSLRVPKRVRPSASLI
ncbi:hypothetical protein BDV40DRAFT_301556 [Aspergillus tamarii]|uniref:Uncharacterized protein n=1 Tax=Aspergillus tamarii TaxID=41984 RepID=A0A5N6URK6_ASPTM|nr:hypothetical protein BDV40DRAFT_301556 [Aspergillus tamarii]